jgi:hypothetical protein
MMRRMTARSRRSRLGDILIGMGAASAAAVDEALDRQILFGGRLGTNLLELGAVQEDALAAALGRLHGCRAAAGPIEVDEAALALLRPDRVDRLEAVPARIDGRRLEVLVADPVDLAKLDEVAFATGKVVQPVVVAESRLWDLLRRHYGLERHARGAPDVAPRLAAAAPAEPQAAAGEDLMGEEEFASLYAQAALAPGAAPHPTPAPRPAPAPGKAPADLPPLSFDEAVAALAGVADRDEIARIVLRYARGRFRRVVLLAVHGELTEGWQGAGEGITPQRVARIRIRTSQPGVVHTVVGSRAHVLGPLARTDENIALLRALGRGAPKTSFAMPVLAREQVVNVLYADDGRGALVDPAGVGELLILAGRISRSYEALLERG